MFVLTVTIHSLKVMNKCGYLNHPCKYSSDCCEYYLCGETDNGNFCIFMDSLMSNKETKSKEVAVSSAPLI